MYGIMTFIKHVLIHIHCLIHIGRGRRTGRKRQKTDARKVNTLLVYETFTADISIFLMLQPEVTVMANLWFNSLYVYLLLLDVSLEKYVMIKVLFVCTMTVSVISIIWNGEFCIVLES